MKWLATAMMVLGALLFLAAAGSRLSPDAIGMALGMVLGVLGGVTTAALVLVALRAGRASDDNVSIYKFPPAVAIGPSPAENSMQIDLPQPFAWAAPSITSQIGEHTVIEWRNPVPCVVLRPGQTPERRYGRFTTPIDEAINSGGFAIVLESEWNRYVMEQEKKYL